jgi:hypothetical protein
LGQFGSILCEDVVFFAKIDSDVELTVIEMDLSIPRHGAEDPIGKHYDIKEELGR